MSLARSVLVLILLLPAIHLLAASETRDGGTLTPNLVANPSMEAGDEETPDAWTFRSDGGAGTWEVKGGHDGKRSLRIDGQGAWLSDPFPLIEGMVTLMEIDTRLEGSGRWGGLARVDFLNAEGTRVGKLDPHLPDEHAWRRMRWGGRAPEGTVAGVLVCYTYRGDQELSLWCDGASVRQWTDTNPPPADDEAPPTTVRRFDMGTKDSAVLPGYERVSAQTRYRKKPGFGWAASVRLAGRDQEDEQYRPEKVDGRGEPVPRGRTFLDPLTRDYVRGVGAARFRVDVPAGRYQAFLLAGHSRPDAAPPYFDLIATSGGARLARLSKRSVGVGYVWETVSVEAGERGLEIGFASDRFGGTWSLSALVVWPEGEEAGFREAERVLRSVRMLPGDLMTRLWRTPVAEEPAGPAPGTVFPVPLGSRSLKGTAGAGLSADFGFSLRSERDLSGCRITAGPAPEDGRSAAPGRVRLWTVQERALRYTEGYVVHDLYTVQPDELTERHPERLVAGRAQPFWLRVQLPADAAGGSYRAVVRVGCQGTREGTIAVDVRALPVAADGVGGIQNLYIHRTAGRVPATAPDGVREEASALRAAAVRDVADHLGAATPALGRWVVYAASGGRWRLEMAYAQEELDDFRRAGQPPHTAIVLLQPILAQLARQMSAEEGGKFGKHVKEGVDLGPEYWKAFGDLVGALDRELEAAGVATRIYNPWDEAHAHDLPVFIRAAQVVRERLDEARVFCNVPTAIYYQGGDAGPRFALAPHCDTWWVYGTLTDEQRAAEHRRGTWLLGRLRSVGYVEARASTGLLRWRRDERGGNWWAYDAYTGSVNTQLDGPSYGDRSLVYPTSPPSPRLAWEAGRMGHEDLRYLRTLERLVEEHEDAPERGVRKAARAGAELLEDLRTMVEPSLPDPLGDGRTYDVVREQLMRAIERIVAAGE